MLLVRTLTASQSLPTERQIKLLGDPSHVVDVSLRWLMQHELNHYAIGHFKITGKAGLLDSGEHTSLAIAAREKRGRAPFQDVLPEDRKYAPLCLELQADHDATEIILGAYAPQNWALFSYYAMCIIAVIMIIEREERHSKEGSFTHPKAATRLFMLLAHLSELPYIPAYKRAYREGLDIMPDAYLPSNHELEGYQNQVLRPVLAISQLLAEAAGLPNVWDELGGAEATYADIETAITHGYEEPEQFKTAAAQQWAALKPANDRILKIVWG